MLLWVGFVGFVLLLLAIDLGVFQRRVHAVPMREALLRSASWMTLGLSFGAFVYFAYDLHWFGLGTDIDSVDGFANDGDMALAKYLTGYIVEQSLSIDNIFVMLTIFTYFGVAPQYQPRVLFWGILGAMVLRGIMIGVGATLIARFHWILQVFGVFLIVAGVRTLFVRIGRTDLDRNRILRFVRSWVPVTSQFHGGHFVVRAGTPESLEPTVPGQHCGRDSAVERASSGALLLTPLGLAVVIVEISDVIFAVDSIPAVFAITADPFLVFSSNVFAILGLRSLYFALTGLLRRFRYLNASIAVVLVVVGTKMLVSSWLKATFGTRANAYLLCLIVAVLGIGAAASLLAPPNDRD